MATIHAGSAVIRRIPDEVSIGRAGTSLRKHNPKRTIRGRILMNHRTNSFAACTALALIAALPVGSARAEIKTQVIEYKQGDTVLEGFLAYDNAVQGKRPAVLVAHTWTGVGDFVRE